MQRAVKSNPILTKDIAYIYEIIHCSCLTWSGIAENDEVVSVEDLIDVGNILEKSLVALCSFPDQWL